MLEAAPCQTQAVVTTALAPSRWRVWLAWACVVLLFAGAIYWGIQLRRWAWDQTTGIRFVNSVSNAIEWGNQARRIGVLEVYDDLYSRFGPAGDYAGPARFALDYPPLRLLIADAWTNWAYDKYAVPKGQTLYWRPDYEFTEPMLRLNMGCELAAAAGMFLLVYRWMRMCALPAPGRWWTWRISQGWGRTEHLEQLRALPSTVGLRAATCAALLIWFNPAVIFNAHVYPQWDVWLLPPLIWAIFFGLIDWWLPAGMAVAISAMTKGQILLALPLLIAWPLLLGNFAAVLRLCVGLLAGVGLVVWPWMTRGEAAHLWMVHVAVSAMLILAAGLLPRRSIAWWVLRSILALAAGVILCAPAWTQSSENLLYTAALSVLVIGIALAGSRWWTPTSLATLWAGSLALTVPLFGASMAWYEVGIKYGTRHWRQLYWCLAPNLGSILQVRFGWRYADVADMSWIPWLDLGQVPIRQVMMALYVIALVPCVIGVVRHRRNHDPRLLLAFAAPLLMAYALLPQMIERYLIWPAAMLSAYAAISFSGLLLWLVLSAIACLMMFGYMLTMVRLTPVSQEWLSLVQSTFPDIGWAVLVLAGVVLCLAVTSSRARPAGLPLAGPRP